MHHYLKQDLKVHMIDVHIIEPDGTRMVEKPKVPKALSGKKNNLKSLRKDPSDISVPDCQQSRMFRMWAYEHSP